MQSIASSPLPSPSTSLHSSQGKTRVSYVLDRIHACSTGYEPGLCPPSCSALSGSSRGKALILPSAPSEAAPALPCAGKRRLCPSGADEVTLARTSFVRRAHHASSLTTMPLMGRPVAKPPYFPERRRMTAATKCETIKTLPDTDVKSDHVAWFISDHKTNDSCLGL